jgi:hypothetical protein
MNNVEKDPTVREYDWLEWDYRPLSDGLHDSGYRFIRVAGVIEQEHANNTYPLHQWADHIVVEGAVNMDVTRDGRMRIMPWDRDVIVAKYASSLGSDAWFEVRSRDQDE